MRHPHNEKPGSLGSQVVALIERHGSPEERRIASIGKNELLSFLDHPDTLHFTRMGLLDIGLENRPVLKFSLMAGGRTFPLGLINDWAERIPALQEAAETVFRHRLRCHAGIKFSPTGVEYEIYPYETPDCLLANGIFAHHSPSRSGLPVAPYCYGCSSSGALSAYAEIKGVEPSELELPLGFPLPVAGLKANAIFNSRLKPDGSWQTDKAGIEFLPCPSHLLNTMLTHFQLNFAYLLHRGGTRRYVVIGMHGSRQVLYTALLPRQQPPGTSR